MLNRKISPIVKVPEKPNVQKAEKHLLKNGIPLYIINAGDQDVVRIDFIFKAGSIFAENPLVAEAANSLIEAGTKNNSSSQIAERFDFYGAYLDLYIGKHTGQMILYSLNKYLENTLKIVTELILYSVYPQNEVDIYLQNRYNNFLINRQKPDVISKEILSELLFGKNSPYGRQIKEEDFKLINSDHLQSFIKRIINFPNLN